MLAMKTCSAAVFFLSACVAESEKVPSFYFAHVSENIVTRFLSKRDRKRSVYMLDEERPSRKLEVVHYIVFEQKASLVPYSVVGFAYDEEDLKNLAAIHPRPGYCITDFVGSWMVENPKIKPMPNTLPPVEAQYNTAPVFKERVLFYVSFLKGTIEKIPMDIARLGATEEDGTLRYTYTKEKEHGDIFDRFLVAEDAEALHREKAIAKLPSKKREVLLLLSFLAEKDVELSLETIPEIHDEEGKPASVKLPSGTRIHIEKDNIPLVGRLDFRNTTIRTLGVSEVNVALIPFRNTVIEELFLLDYLAVLLFSNEKENLQGVEIKRLSFCTGHHTDMEYLVDLVNWTGDRHGERETPWFGKIQLEKNITEFLIAASENKTERIHTEELCLISDEILPCCGDIKTRIAAEKRICIRGNVSMLLFVEASQEIDHLDLEGMKKDAFPWNTMQVLEFCLSKEHLLLTDCNFFNEHKKPRLGKEGLESIRLSGAGIGVLAVAGDVVAVDALEIIGSLLFTEQEKAVMLGKTFKIKKKLVLKHRGIFFLKFIQGTDIPSVEIKIGEWLLQETAQIEGFERFLDALSKDECKIRTGLLEENFLKHLSEGGKQKIEKIVLQKKIRLGETQHRLPSLVFDSEGLNRTHTAEVPSRNTSNNARGKEMLLKERYNPYSFVYED